MNARPLMDQEAVQRDWEASEVFTKLCDAEPYFPECPGCQFTGWRPTAAGRQLIAFLKLFSLPR